MSTLTALGGEAAREHHDAFARCLIELLAADPADIGDAARYRAALNHGFSYYFWKWDPRAAALYEPLCQAVTRRAAEPVPDIDLTCDILDFLFFVVWCFDESSTMQCKRLVEPMRAASHGLARTCAPRALPPPAKSGPYRIAWLAMYANSDNPMSVALRNMAPAFRAKGHELHVYAWRFADDAFVAFLESVGAVVHRLEHVTATQTILAVERQAARDAPDIAITDMNNAVPTALFSRRLAPVQILLQAGMPAWPVLNLDAVYNSFGFDAAVAGWGDAMMLSLAEQPWDVEALDRPADPAEIAAERAGLPQGLRLIGSYGRLSKVTEPYLQAAEQVLSRCADVALVIGGTGDRTVIDAFIAASPVGNRMHLEARFVPGHVWGRILDVMLDTWPVTGGESCREVISKGKPVVTRNSDEMPAINLQRDSSLVCATWPQYVDAAVRLLQDGEEYAAACARARGVRESKVDAAPFARRLDEDLARLVRSARRRRSLTGRISSWLQAR